MSVSYANPLLPVRTTGLALGLVILMVGVIRAQAPHPDPDRQRVPAGAAIPRATALAILGRALFLDARLSASGAMSCASCHDPANHFAPDNGLDVQLGGVKLDLPGIRAVPSLAYAAATPFFTEHFTDPDDGENGGIDEGPAGGRTWDGRVDRPRDQVAIPLLARNEMANADEDAVVARVAVAPYSAQMRQLFGERIFSDTRKAFVAIGEAIEAYQETPADFSPFTSRYDAYLRGQLRLTGQEMRGLALFIDPARGNCQRCHRALPTVRGSLPVFTDFGYSAIGVPRNRRLARNADPSWFDLGLCGPERRDLSDNPEYCGLFKTPSLRNVATRKVFFHNGVMHSLRDAVAFYATRDTDPGRWYPRGRNGQVRKYDDLPARYQGNIDNDPPFGGKPGDAPRLTDQDVSDIVAFLATLTDGYLLPGTSTRVTPQVSSIRNHRLPDQFTNRGRVGDAMHGEQRKPREH